MEGTTRSSSSAFWCGVRIGRSAPGAAPRVLLLLSCFISQLNAPLHDGNPTFYAHYYPRENLNVLDRARIISPNASDAEQIRTPKVASFLRDVALRDLAVHATHAACVDGRGDVYQWGDGFFGQQQSESASGDRKPVLTLRGKVRSCLSLSMSLRSKKNDSFHLLYCFSLLMGITAVVCVCVARRTSRGCRSRNLAYLRFRLPGGCMSYRRKLRQVSRCARALLLCRGGARAGYGAAMTSQVCSILRSSLPRSLHGGRGENRHSRASYSKIQPLLIIGSSPSPQAETIYSRSHLPVARSCILSRRTPIRMANLGSASSTSLTPLRRQPRLRGFTLSSPRELLPILTPRVLVIHVNHARPLPVCLLHLRTSSTRTTRTSSSRTDSSRSLR